MCVVSMVMDHQWDKWKKYIPTPYDFPSPVVDPYKVEPVDAPYPAQPVKLPKKKKPKISKEEIEEFKRLLERAKKYDKDNNQKDCEMAEKKEALKKLAKILGVDISFVDEI